MPKKQVTNPRKKTGPSILLTDEFVNRKIQPEMQVVLENFEHCPPCQYALKYIRECGNSSLFEPVRAYYYPRLVRFFWQQVELRENGGLYFVFAGREDRITTKEIVASSGHIGIRPADCPYAEPSRYMDLPDALQVAKTIGNGTLTNRGGMSRNTLNRPELIFFDAILKAAVHSNGHSRVRRHGFLHALFTAHHDRWFSVPGLVLLGLKSFAGQLAARAKLRPILHYPYFVTALLEYFQFPILPEEEKITGWTKFTGTSKQFVYNKQPILQAESSRSQQKRRRDVVEDEDAAEQTEDAVGPPEHQAHVQQQQIRKDHMQFTVVQRQILDEIRDLRTQVLQGQQEFRLARAHLADDQAHIIQLLHLLRDQQIGRPAPPPSDAPESSTRHPPSPGAHQ